jgi:manganese-dependent inorganic pyrophosphatase
LIIYFIIFEYFFKQVSRIVGVIDHHALQNATIVTDMPIYIDIRPWGSMSTIITHNFITLERRPTKATAGMLLCAILSDTLNLQGPTTTEWDRLMVAILVQLAEIDDVQFLASQQFKAKSSELANLSPSVLINGDQKIFSYKTAYFHGSIGFAVIETTDDEVILTKTAELLVALSEDKESKNLTALFLAVVNIVELRTKLLLCSEIECDLAQSAFESQGQLLESYILDLGSLVSRKKDFIPAMTTTINKRGWMLPQDRRRQEQSLSIDNNNNNGNVKKEEVTATTTNGSSSSTSPTLLLDGSTASSVDDENNNNTNNNQSQQMLEC